MEFESKLRCSMSALVYLEHAHVINTVTKTAFIGTEDLTHL